MTIKSANKFILSGILAFSTAFLFTGCDGEQGDAEDNMDSVDTTMEEVTMTKPKQNVFYSIPSPIQLGKMLKRAGANYDLSVLNNKDNVSNYSTTAKKALNLGVYGADMSYSAIFGQTQECLNYLDASKALADQLGSSGAFAGETIEHLKKHSNNKDSLLYMISDIFLNSNEAFKDNEQGNVALLAIAGGFVEGLYVGTQVAKTIDDNKDVVTRIAELKGSLNNIVALLGTDTSGDEDLAAVLNDLKEIKAVYDQMEMQENTPTVTADSSSNVITIGGSAKYELSKEQLESITAKTEALRNRIVGT